MPTYQPRPAPLDPIETASTDELRGLQQSRLLATIRHAYVNSPHYRSVFDEAGLRPGDITGLDQLAQLPFTTKEDLRRHYPFGMFAVARQQLARIHASSGTTGRPTVVGYTAEDLRTWAAVMARSLRAAGARPGQLLHNAYGYGLFTGGLGVHAGAEHLGCTVVPVSGGMTERQVQLIADFQPDIITVTPTYMLAIADEMQRRGIDPAATSLKVGIFGAEPWTDQLRHTLEQRLDLHAVDIYGLSEVIGPGVAQECLETKDGLHVWEDHFYPEIVDPVTGEPLADGQLGELVFTSLTKQAMPILRYRTGDLTRLLPGTARTMRRIQKITGRTDDMMIVRGVNVFPTQIEELLLKQPALAPHFQCVLGKDGPLDTLTVTAEPAPGTSPDAAETAGRELAGRIKNTIGVTVAVRIVPAGTVERSAGKMRRIVDTRAS
jgi:phenylacetate-CoA ligase